MIYRAAPEYTVRWTDGFSWVAPAETFERITTALDALREVIVDLAPVLDRWSAIAQRDATLDVDAFAPTEGDRAVLTAALARALDDALAEDEPADGIVDRLRALHELFVTDVTRRD